MSDKVPAPGMLDALVLAGSRGPTEDLAAGAGQRHKALLPVAGMPMLARVVHAVNGAAAVGRIVVSIDDPAALDLAGLGALARDGVVRHVGCWRSPSATVVGCLESGCVQLPVLVTTADHALLTWEMVDYFCAAAVQARADVVVGAVSADVLRARYPESRRTLIRLRGSAFSGANLFAFMTPRAAAAARFWVRAEQFRKRPWRLVRLFGLLTLVRFALRRLPLDGALARVSRVMGAEIALVQMPFAECAIDVDGADDLLLAARILEERGSGVQGPVHG